MAINKLTTRRVETVRKPGRYADGGGLYLVVDKRGSRRWVFMSWLGGQQREFGLGGLSAVSLKRAREIAVRCRELAAEGRDPRLALESRPAPPDAPPVPSFGEFADIVITSLESGWRNDKHRQQWRNSLDTYAAAIRDKPVDDVNTDDVLTILSPIWTAKAETASRVRGRIEKILDAAKARGLRTGENPARWRGHLDHLLPRRQKLQRGHHPAMAWAEVPAFVARLRERHSVSALALEFVILTAARSGEVLRSVRGGELMGARWSEIDRDAKVWTVPGKRMKGGREHRVPLTDRALTILDMMAEIQQGEFIFPGQRGDRPLSEMALELQMRRMNAKPATVHGFRSSFRDWVSEATSFPGDLAEAALAHITGDAVERAYRRGDALERRRAMMEAWSLFIHGQPQLPITSNRD